jgi:ZIP family zinc transporter
MRTRQVAGLALMPLGLAAGAHLAWTELQPYPRVVEALAAGSIAALATALGAIPVLLSHRLGDALRDALNGFGASVMLAASAFSLVIPGLAAARAQGIGAMAAGLIVAFGLLVGASLLLVMDDRLSRRAPHDATAHGAAAAARQRAWLFVAAIVLHNLPEGLAIGVAHAGGDRLQASALTTGIAIQDVPEGFVVAMALVSVGYRRRVALGLGMASGLVEPVGAVLGAAVITLSSALLPWGMAFAAGAMLGVVCHAMIPDAHHGQRRVAATAGLLLGFAVMMVLDTAIG